MFRGAELSERGCGTRRPFRELLYVMTGATAVDGGIAAVNLSVLRSLVRMVEETKGRLTVYSFLETEHDRAEFLPEWVPFKGFEGNRAALASHLLVQYVSQRPTYFFDHVGLHLPVLPLAMARAAKTVIFAHGWENWRSVRRTDRWSLQAATLCLANSNFTLSQMRRSLSGVNVKACSLGLSPNFNLNTKVPKPPTEHLKLKASGGKTYELGSRVLLLVARMHSAERQKGHYALLQVLAPLRKRYEDVQLVFAGEGDDRRNVEELAHRQGVSDCVFFTGRVPVSLLQRLYHRCYAFVMPSTQEGFGLAYLEAMNYGKPCVGCSNQGAEEVIVHGETGYLVRDPEDRQELLQVLDVLLGNPAQARVLGTKGFDRLQAHFTSEHFERRLREQLASVW